MLGPLISNNPIVALGSAVTSYFTACVEFCWGKQDAFKEMAKEQRHELQREFAAEFFKAASREE
jgi:hypothetical protein